MENLVSKLADISSRPDESVQPSPSAEKPFANYEDSRWQIHSTAIPSWNKNWSERRGASSMLLVTCEEINLKVPVLQDTNFFITAPAHIPPLNSSPPSAAYMHHWTRSALVQPSGNGLAPFRRQAITWTNADLLSSGLLGTNFSEILIKIHTFSFKKMHLKMLSAKWRAFCLGLKVLSYATRIFLLQQ